MQVSGLGRKPGEAEDTGRAGHRQEDTPRLGGARSSRVTGNEDKPGDAAGRGSGGAAKGLLPWGRVPSPGTWGQGRRGGNGRPGPGGAGGSSRGGKWQKQRPTDPFSPQFPCLVPS